MQRQKGQTATKSRNEDATRKSRAICAPGLTYLLAAMLFLLGLQVSSSAFGADCVKRGKVDYKGLPFLSSMKAFRKKFGHFNCETTGTSGLCESSLDSYAGKPVVLIRASFLDDRFSRVEVAAFPSDLSEIEESLVARFGAPSEPHCIVKSSSNKEWAFPETLIQTYLTEDDKLFVVRFTNLKIVRTDAARRAREQARKEKIKDM